MKRILVMLFLLGQLQAQSDLLYWIPEQPEPGGEVQIFYNAVQGSLPDDANPVNIHIGENGWQNVVDYPMQDEGQGWWSHTHSIGTDVTILDFVFFDNNGNWDNNGGQGIDYHIPVNERPLWSPLTPGPNDTITIAVASGQAGWLWWGVNGWTAPISNYWPAGAQWGEEGLSIDCPMDGPDSTGYLSLQLGPFNRVQQPVATVDFVFHFADGSWDNHDGSDYQFALDFTPGPDDPSIQIVNLEDGDILTPGQVVEVTAQNSVYNEVRLDGNTLTINPGSNFQVPIDVTSLDLGRHQLNAYARRDNGRVMMDFLDVWKVPELVYADFPPFDHLGVHDRLDGTATFALLAPGKKFISLIGSFNDWDPAGSLMNFDSVQGIWWLNIPLAPGTYQYMYEVDGEKRLGDPFATDMDWTDLFGEEDWRPENQKSIVEIGAEPYPWTDDGYVRPAMQDLVIYELLIRDFSDSGDLQGVIDRLDYLQDLGVNAIEFMPPTEFPGASSWGYNPAVFMSLESSYGTPEDMQTLVNEAHSRGIAVLVDLVFNHADASSPCYQLYDGDNTLSPYFHDEGNAWGFPDFDHGRVGTRALVSRTVRHWINAYHVDGYRYDHTPGIGWSGVSDFGVSYFSNEAWLEDPEVYQIAEHFDNDVWSLIEITHIRSHWHDAFHDQMKANLRQGPFEGSWYGDMNRTEQGLSFAADGFSLPEAAVNYLESHDEQRVIFEAQTNGLSYEQAMQKAKLGAGVLFTSAGIPMFYMGAELGMDTERTLDANPVLWDYLNDPENAGLYELYRRLLWLRQEYAALRSDQFVTTFKNSSQRVIAFQRNLTGEPSVVVAVNFNTTTQSLDLEFPQAGTWYEFMEDDTVAIETNWYGNYSLPPSSIRIFTNERRWVGVGPEPLAPLSFALHTPMPNPFNPATTLRFDLNRAGATRLTIFDLRGRIVWQRNLGRLTAGSHELIWTGVDQQGKDLPSGSYLVRLDRGSQSGFQKVLLLK